MSKYASAILLIIIGSLALYETLITSGMQLASALAAGGITGIGLSELKAIYKKG